MSLFAIASWLFACFGCFYAGYERGRHDELRDTEAMIDRLERIVDGGQK